MKYGFRLIDSQGDVISHHSPRGLAAAVSKAKRHGWTIERWGGDRWYPYHCPRDGVVDGKAV